MKGNAHESYNLPRGGGKKGLKTKAFTLAEVLITLVIIGVIAAITVPMINQQQRLQQYKSAAKKAQSVLNQAVLKFRYDEGYVPLCSYWEKRPYGASKCLSYDEKGNCKNLVLASNGGPIPSDYNGNFDDCFKLYNSFLKNLNIQKVCNSDAYGNGCIPKYEGIDTIYSSKNPNATEQEVAVATASGNGWNREKILGGRAFVTNDGMIFFPYSLFKVPIIAVDLNGQKGPNKWGVDIHTFWLVSTYSQKETPRVKYYGHSYMLEKGGVTTKSILDLD